MERTMQRYLVVSCLLVLSASPVLAAEYYVGRNVSTGECKVSTTKPDGKTMVMVGTSSYPTKAEAKTAKQAATECPKKSGK
jgi:hypothetical protein